MNGGNSSQTATEESKRNDEPKNEFKAFKGKGVSLGSDIDVKKMSKMQPSASTSVSSSSA